MKRIHKYMFSARDCLASRVRSVYNVYGTATNETVMTETGTAQIATGLDAWNRVVSLTSRGETVQGIRRR